MLLLKKSYPPLAILMVQEKNRKGGQETWAGTFGIPERMPPIRRRNFIVNLHGTGQRMQCHTEGSGRHMGDAQYTSIYTTTGHRSGKEKNMLIIMKKNNNDHTDKTHPRYRAKKEAVRWLLTVIEFTVSFHVTIYLRPIDTATGKAPAIGIERCCGERPDPGDHAGGEAAFEKEGTYDPGQCEMRYGS